MKILFVCIGNTCRSPMAEAVLKNKLKEKNVLGSFVRSCGINAQTGAPANPFAIRVINENGLALNSFCSTQISQNLFDWADVVICMTKELAKSFHSEKVCDFSTLYGLPEISDPYGCTIECYRDTFGAIDYVCNLLANDIAEDNLLNRIKLSAKRK